LRAQIHHLELIYPPITNQQAEWLKNSEETVEWLKRSKLYFIAQRAECKFQFKDDVLNQLQDNRIINFIFINGNLKSEGQLSLIDLLSYHNFELDHFDDYEIELGDDLIRIWSFKNGEKEILDWFTCEKLLHDRTRNVSYLNGLDNYRSFAKYKLHYIGISKVEDSFSRLVIKPHDKRLRILSNEHSIDKNSRLTDEMILFFFDIDSLEIKQYLQPSDFDEFGLNGLEDRVRIVADAEKAFVKIMNTEYNEVKFKEYPFSEDGLFDSKVERYSFSINENIEFQTTDNLIYGERNPKNIGFSNADFISIDKENKTVQLIKIKNSVA
jgi:hypothetical protein